MICPEGKKLIHSVGVVVDSQFVPVKNSYTGIFSGCMNVVSRLSLATEADPKAGEGAFAPGIALKFMRNKIHSANVFVMYSLVGQGSFNFFEHDLTSHVPELSHDAPTPLQLLRQKFLTASKFPVFTGLSDLALFDENGNRISTPNFPFRLHFHANTTLHRSLPYNYTGAEFEDQLIRVLQPNSHIYDIYAQDTPDSEKLVLIGSLRTKQHKASRSNFADKEMFFQHTRFEDDLKHKPQWEDKSNEIMEDQRATDFPGYHYPDLAWK